VKVEALAQGLLEKEVLQRHDLVTILGDRPFVFEAGGSLRTSTRPTLNLLLLLLRRACVLGGMLRTGTRSELY